MVVPVEAFFVLTSPVVALVLLVLMVRLRLPPRDAALLCAFYVYLLVVARYTLFPLADLRLASEYRADTSWFSNANFVPFRDFDFGDRHSTGNLALGVPFGVLVPALLHGRRRLGVVVLAALGIGVAVEALQFVLGGLGFVRYRSVDVNDLFLNTLGAALGLAWFLIARSAYALAEARLAKP